METELLQQTLETVDGCKIWQGATYPSGYAKIRIDGTAHVGHRLLYTLHHGAIPEGMLVLHKCDQRACIIPEHLRAGTSTENNQDTLARHNNPRARGGNHGSAKLTEYQVREIRKLLAAGHKPRGVAELFETPYKTIIAIKSRATWGWLDV